MELLAVLCAVAVLFLLCAALTLKLHIPASAAPLTALACLAAVLTLAGNILADVCYGLADPRIRAAGEER